MVNHDTWWCREFSFPYFCCIRWRHVGSNAWKIGRRLMTENLTVGHRIKCRFMSLSYSGSHGTMAVLLLHTLGKRYQCPYRTSLQGRLGIFFSLSTDNNSRSSVDSAYVKFFDRHLDSKPLWNSAIFDAFLLWNARNAFDSAYLTLHIFLFVSFTHTSSSLYLKKTLYSLCFLSSISTRDYDLQSCNEIVISYGIFKAQSDFPSSDVRTLSRPVRQSKFNSPCLWLI